MHEPDAKLRAHAAKEGVKLLVRSFTLTGLGRASWDAQSPHASALDFLLAAVATDLVSGMAKAAEDLELRLEAFLENPLVVAGVVGEDGSPRVARIRGSLYVRSDSPDLHEAWRRVRAGSPVLASLAPEVAIDIQLKEIP